METLLAARDRTILPSKEIHSLTPQLPSIDDELWDIKAAIRGNAQNSDVCPHFVEFACSVYQTNDRCAAVKWWINERLRWEFVEAKSDAAKP
jgi:hypothetical protein